MTWLEFWKKHLNIEDVPQRVWKEKIRVKNHQLRLLFVVQSRGKCQNRVSTSKWLYLQNTLPDTVIRHCWKSCFELMEQLHVEDIVSHFSCHPDISAVFRCCSNVTSLPGQNNCQTIRKIWKGKSKKQFYFLCVCVCGCGCEGDYPTFKLV